MGALRLDERSVRAVVAAAGQCDEAVSGSGQVPDVLSALAGLVRCDVMFWNAYRLSPRFEELALVPWQGGRTPRRAPHREWLEHLPEHPVMCGRHGRVVAVSDVLSRRQFERSWAYQEAFLPAGVEHEIGVQLSHGADAMSVVVLSRGPGRDFSARDHVVLELLRPHVDAALRRLSSPSPALTRRQVEVMRLVREGLSDGQIARRLAVSEATVGKHLEHVYARAGARSRVQAVALCAAALGD